MFVIAISALKAEDTLASEVSWRSTAVFSGSPAFALVVAELPVPLADMRRTEHRM